ncbi:ADP-ribosylglycohydrolase family protein [Fibrella sp. WM1]|uniref:ADP-ribosylglycohydrolase family protein n=1 Tax=Fibrella musci TaxID=3242485 RepID=UPI003520A2EF
MNQAYYIRKLMDIDAQKITAALFGLAVGDALGVPVEFQRRAALVAEPVTTMQGYGTHNQPPGTWSDDSSLVFCLAESLCHGYDLDDLARRFINWNEHGYWTPHGTVFDIGIATSKALGRLATGISPTLAGGKHEDDNGNGSLMRILPLVFVLQHLPIRERYERVADVSSLTHGHSRSILACFLYCEYALELLQGTDKHEALQTTRQRVLDFVTNVPELTESELAHFGRILGRAGSNEGRRLPDYAEADIASSGYVIHTLEASLWCFLTTDSYREAVLKAVNLGSDTDTTGCVTGGLAGLYYGITQIPTDWLNVLARRADIEQLAQRLGTLL